MHPGHRALQAAPRRGLSMVRASRSRALLTLPVLPLPGTAKAPSGEGAEGLRAPGPPNAA